MPGLFARLDSVTERFVDWVALGAVDIEDYIEQNCTAAEHWEANFRASKVRFPPRVLDLTYPRGLNLTYQSICFFWVFRLEVKK